MIRTFMYVIDVGLVVFLVREILQFTRGYRQLKEALAAGDLAARMRLYRRVLRFQWLSAGLAVAALRVDWSAFDPRSLSLESVPPVQSLLASMHEGGFSGLTGLASGVVLGTVALVAMRLRARRGRGASSARVAPWQRLLPDFSAVLPVTGRERWMWLAVSISAGVCEEVVFRGWLLAVLHTPLGIGGMALILTAAACFGVAHAYQGVAGVVLTFLAGVLFCVLYVATGGLLVPMVLHTIVDARFALLPRAEDPTTESLPGIPGLRAI